VIVTSRAAIVSLRAHVNVHQSFMMIVGASLNDRRCLSQRGNRACESVGAIRPKNGFWRAAMRREADEHENFFIAKIRDSESVQRALGGRRRVAAASIA
jgi:hypothetical protein